MPGGGKVSWEGLRVGNGLVGGGGWWWMDGWRGKRGKGFVGFRRRGGRRGIAGRTEEETFPDLEEVGSCEVMAGC